MRRLYSTTLSTKSDGTWQWSIESTPLGKDANGSTHVTSVGSGVGENFPVALAAMGTALMMDHVSRLEWPAIPPEPGTEAI